jgi:hypothetical protein
MIAQVEQRGNAAILKALGTKVGGKARVSGHRLVKKDVTTGQTGQVPVYLPSPRDVDHSMTDF